MSILASIVIWLLIKVTIAAQGPCDIFAQGGHPCVAAHSTTRALFGAYNGPLYQVNRTSDRALRDIGVVSAGGVANAATQNSFCQGHKCVIQKIYDQSSSKNDLNVGPAGGYVKHPDLPVNATRFPTTLSGHNVYAAYFEGGMGYRNDRTQNMAKGNNPETLYMVTSGKHVNGGCCFDYGNAETTNNDDGAGTMEAIYFGTCSIWGRGSGSGPWVMADLENGLWAGNVKQNNNNTPLTSNFVFAMLKGKENGFTLKGGDATTGSLKTMYDGARPAGYQPMKKQGAIILGIGGDNSNSGIGTFFEGAITNGLSSDTTDNAVYNNVIAAKYK